MFNARRNVLVLAGGGGHSALELTRNWCWLPLAIWQSRFFDTLVMDAAPSFTNAEWAQQLAAERALREQAEAELARVRARLTALEQPAAAPFQALHTQIGKLVHHLRLGVVLVDGSGQIQYVSPHFWRMFGLTPVAGPPFTPGQLFIDEAFADPAAFTSRVWALHTAGKTVLGEAFLLRDGRRLVLDYLVLDEAGAGRLICYRDVTRAHQRMTRTRAISHIPEQNPEPVFQLTAMGETVYANLAAGAFLRALAAEPAGQQWVLELVRTALGAPAQPHPAEMALAGQHYQLVAAAVPGQAYVTLHLTDITARYQAEQQMVQQREFYESVLEQVPTAVVVFDNEHRYLFINSSVEPDPALRAWMLGKTSAEACARRQRPAASAPQRAAAFAEVLRTGREVQWEETLSHADGTVRHIMIWYRPVRGLGGTALVIGLSIDLTERKRAEQLVVQQQEFYESILNLLPVDVAVFDAEHRFRFVNPSSISDPAVRRQIIGLTNDEYFALRQQQHPTGLVQQRKQYFDLAVRTGRDVTWEETRTDRNQRPQLIMRHLRPVFGTDGTLRLVVGSGIDITSRYQAEKLQHEVQAMLQEQQNFVRQIVDNLPNVIYLVSAEGGVSFSNKAYNEAALLAQHQQLDVDNPVVLKEVEQVRSLNQQVRATRQALTVDLPFTQISGEVLYFQMHKRPMLRADGQVDILTVSTDVTAVRQARYELERREKQYHDLVYYSQALICTHDLQGKLLTVNPAIERLMGVPAAQLVGRNLREVLPPPRAALRAYLKGANLPHDQARMVVLRTGTGKLRYLHYYTYQVTDEGRPPYVLASGYDVTSGVLAERALRQAKQQAEENAQAKETFLARMSHEIRTPLNGVLGMAGLLQKTPLTAAQQEYLNTMQHAGRHLLALLNDVLDMAKISADHLQLNQAPFDVGVVLHGAGQAVAALAAEKGLTLIVEPLAAPLPRVLGDAYRLHQVLLNLLGNAIKFTESGSVRLGAAVCPGPGQAHEAVVRFWVEDTGIGMTPAEQAHIFEAFAQANTETSLRFGGTGLGLAISQQLVVQMGGTLRVCSEPGRGTTFSFQLTLPHVLAAAQAAQPGLPPATSYEGLRGLRVLLAEDNLVNQQIAVAVLEYWGVQVHAVSNGTDALARLEAERFEVAILDIRMPGLSGVEVTQAIRRHPEAAHANIPVIALTANAFESDLVAYLAAGMTACLTKPYEEADLCELLLRLASQLPGKSAPGTELPGGQMRAPDDISGR